jgi:hypothetical protein
MALLGFQGFKKLRFFSHASKGLHCRALDHAAILFSAVSAAAHYP